MLFNEGDHHAKSPAADFYETVFRRQKSLDGQKSFIMPGGLFTFYLLSPPQLKIGKSSPNRCRISELPYLFWIICKKWIAFAAAILFPRARGMKKSKRIQANRNVERILEIPEEFEIWGRNHSNESSECLSGFDESNFKAIKDKFPRKMIAVDTPPRWQEWVLDFSLPESGMDQCKKCFGLPAVWAFLILIPKAIEKDRAKKEKIGG